jgi:Tol biopolymer transport system component
MSPEQAKGKKVDKRADIWSWGVVLYELLTGEPLFKGGDATDTLAQVLTKEPPLERVPPQVRKLLRRCLEKDPKGRLRDIGDARDLLEAPAAPSTPTPSRSRFGIISAVAAVLLIAVAALGFVAWKHFREEPPEMTVFTFPPPQKGNVAPNLVSISISPDGRRAVLETVVERKRLLWVRDLDNPAPRMLAEIDDSAQTAFWAPNSRELAFFDGSKLKRIDLAGGPPVPITDTAGTTRGTGSWNQDDAIIFGSAGTPLFRVPAGGGTPAPLTQLDEARNEREHSAPWFLPDGRHFLYLAVSTDPKKSAVYVGDLGSKIRKQVTIGATRAIYANPGYLLYVRDQTLMAQPFRTNELETTGDAVPLAEQIYGADIRSFWASQNGTLAYISGSGGASVQLTWFDYKGTKLDAVGAPANLEWFSLSPDDSTVAFTRDAQGGRRFDIFTHDLARGSESRLTTSGDNHFPVWSWDGSRVYFARNRNGTWKVYQKNANNTGSEDEVEAAYGMPMAASRDGHYLFVTTPPDNLGTGNDIWVLPLSGDGKPQPYVKTKFSEGRPRLSPNSHWLAYQSNELGGFQIHVVSFPKPSEKWTISTSGGMNPVWRHDGRELYYYSLDGKIMAVEVKPGPQRPFGPPKALFEVRISTFNTGFEVSNNGHFLLPMLVEHEASAPMTVVLNWPELLKKK